MSLDVAKLEKVRELAGGWCKPGVRLRRRRSRRSGEHLRIYPDGPVRLLRHPKDGEHRKRIWALAGCKLHLSPAGSVSLRLKTPPAMPSTRSVTAAFTSFNSRTPRTAKTESETSVPPSPLPGC